MEGSATKEPIAIIGIGLRFPHDVNNTRELVDALENGDDLRRDLPADRWNREFYYSPEKPAPPGKCTILKAAVMSDVRSWDNEFFKISPAEARGMDPGLRILLEVVQEMFDDAGVDTEKYKGSRCGVYVGHGFDEYLMLQQADPKCMTRYAAAGNSHTMFPNRVSFFYDLRGPSLMCDTACSSALTACEGACSAIWSGQATSAIVAGVNVILNVQSSIGFSQMSMLSPSQRCAPFDKDADGFCRGEGVGAVLMKPLSQALKDGDHVYGVVRAIALNNDGHGADSVTMPSRDAQQDLLKYVYEKHALDPSSIAFVEAHGTGTPVGDPIESAAIGSIIGAHRETPLPIGSIKGNMGHLEWAAGIAGLIKGLLMLKHQRIFPTIHHHVMNPKIDAEKLNIQVPTKAQPLVACKEGPLRIAVNSFGFGGSNAHVVLEEAKTLCAKDDVPEAGWTVQQGEGKATLFLLSSVGIAGPAGLQAVVDSWKSFAHWQPDVDAARIAAWQGVCRTHRDLRCAIVASSASELQERLEMFSSAKSNQEGSITQNLAMTQNKGLLVVFSGQGPQWPGMGVELYATEPKFRETIDRIDSLWKGIAGWSLLQDTQLFVSADCDEDRLSSDPSLGQPATFALQVALFELMKMWGLRPSAVVGHSAGEPAAAYAAQRLTLRDALRVVHARSSPPKEEGALKSMQGAMLALGISEEESLQLCLEQGDETVACVAAVNAPTSVTLAGDPTALQAIAKTAQAQGKFARFLNVKRAYHSPRLAPLQQQLATLLNDGMEVVTPDETSPVFYSSATGTTVDGCLDHTFWWKNVRGTVRFADAVQSASRDGHCDAVVELGPHPVLIRSTRASLPKDVLIAGSLRRNTKEHARLLSVLGALWTKGMLDPSLVLQSPARNQPVVLPMRTWNRREHWQESTAARMIQDGKQPLHQQKSTLLTDVTEDGFPWMLDHAVDDQPLFPAAGFFSLAVEKMAPMSGPLALESIEFMRALPLGGQQDTNLHVEGQGDGRYLIREGDLVYASGKVVSALPPPPSSLDVAELQKKLPITLEREALYTKFAKAGFTYGPVFQSIDTLHCGEGEALGWIRSIQMDPSNNRRIPIPTMDAFLQVGLGAMGGALEKYLPVGFQSVHLWRNLPLDQPLVVYARLVAFTEETMMLDVDVALSSVSCLNGIVHVWQGEILLSINGFEGKSVSDRVTVPRWDMSPTSCPVPLFEIQYQERACPALDMTCRLQSMLMEGNDLGEYMEEVAVVSKSMTQLDRLCALYARRALRVVPEENIHPTRIRFARALRRIASLTEEEEMDPDRLAETLAQGAMKEEKQGRLDLEVARRGGHMAPNVLRDPGTAVGALFADDLLSKFYARGSIFGVYMEATGQAVGKAIRSLVQHSDRRLHVLEIGAGTGGLTAHLLPYLEGVNDQCTYTYTDLSAAFLAPARKRFAQYAANMRFTTLDLSAPLEEQGHVVGSYDIVVMGDVLHATPDVIAAARRVHDLLVPGGYLVALEVTKTPAFIDLAFGALDGWWAAEDFRMVESDEGHPCLSGARWEGVMKEAGFAEYDFVTTKDEFVHSVLVTRKPSLPILQSTLDDTWTVLVDKQIPQAMQSLIASNMKVVVQPQEAWLEAVEDTTKHLVLWMRGEDALDDVEALRSLFVGLAPRDDLSLYILTRGATMNVSRVEASAATGFARTMINEMKSLHVHSLDLPSKVSELGGTPTMKPQMSAEQLKQVNLCLLGGYGNEPEMVLRDQVYVPRMVEHAAPPPAIPTDVGVHVVMDDQVRIHAQHPPQPSTLLTRVTVQYAHMGSHTVVGHTKNSYVVAFSTTYASTVDAEHVAPCPEHLGLMAASVTHRLASILYTCKVLGRLRPQDRVMVLPPSPLANVVLDSLNVEIVEDHPDVVLVVNEEGTLPAKMAPGTRVLDISGQQCCTDSSIAYLSGTPDVTMVWKEAAALLPNVPAEEVNVIPLQEWDGSNAIVALKGATPTYPSAKLFRSDASYLITGGLGGLGLKLAQWIVKEGGSRLILLGRSGARTVAARQTIQQLEGMGVTIHVVAADASDEKALRQIVESCPSNKPLRGVFHLAMVLRDGPLVDATAQDLEACMRPKANAVLALHRVTQNAPLDHFVMTSSVSCFTGNPGQVGYVAGNAVLEALAIHRRQHGLPALSVALPAVEGAGYVSQSDRVKELFAVRGVEMVPYQNVLDALRRLLMGEQQLVRPVMAAKCWKAFSEFSNNPAPFLHLSTVEASLVEDAEQLVSIVRDEHQAVQLIAHHVASLLDMPPSQLQPHQSLADLGLDSLMAVDMVQWLRKQLGVEVTQMQLLGGATIQSIASQAKVNTEDNQGGWAGAVQSVVVEEKKEEPQEESGGQATTAMEEQQIGRLECLVLTARSQRLWGKAQRLMKKGVLPFHIPVVSQGTQHKSTPADLCELIEEDGGPQEVNGGADVYVRPPVRGEGESFAEEPLKATLMASGGNYHGLAWDSRMIDAAQQAASEYGVGSLGSRLQTGTTDDHRALEEEMAAFVGEEQCITYPSGFTAVFGAVSGLVKAGDIVFCDRENHACIFDGARASGARIVTYAHSPDPAKALNRVLEANPASANCVRLVVTDGVFSATGETVSLLDIARVCRKHKTALLVDEAHSMGMTGATGRGVTEVTQLHGVPTLRAGTFSKAFGAIGGWVAGPASILALLRFEGRAYVFTSALTAVQVAACRTGIQILNKESSWRMQRLERNANYWRSRLQKAGLDVMGNTAIVGWRVPGDDKLMNHLNLALLARGVIVHTFPSKVGSGVVRTSVSSMHSMEDLDRAATVVIEESVHHGLISPEQAQHSLPEAGNMQWMTCLESSQKGSLQEALKVVTLPRPHELVEDQVEIAVRVAGVNFRDVMNALGVYPGLAGKLGVECVGTISRVGSKSTFQVGDRVFGLAQGAFGSHCICPSSYVVHAPSDVSDVDCAGAPLVYLTALLGLQHMAQIRPGERVLIHAISGGVGMAAMHIALRAGCEVFGTCSKGKRYAIVRAGIPADHLFDSRSTSFSSGIMETTQGKGVHVVLNSLTQGDFIPKTLECLAQGGRWVEIARHAIWSAERMHKIRPDVVRSTLDLFQLGNEDPLIIRDLLEVLAGDLGSSLPTLPSKVFDMGHVADAFEYIRQARHIGKVVVVIKSSTDVPKNKGHKVQEQVSKLQSMWAEEPRGRGWANPITVLGFVATAVANKARTFLSGVMRSR